jgi:hypothetical protein
MSRGQLHRAYPRGKRDLPRENPVKVADVSREIAGDNHWARAAVTAGRSQTARIFNSQTAVNEQRPSE